MFSRVLIANRGEIACRIMRTLDALGIESVLVHSRKDSALAYVREHPRARALPDSDRTGGYLNIDAIIAVARETGCDAVHPGYGFLSENPDFARACAAAGVVFIGPSAESMSALGDKARAREMATRAGVPVVPGVDDEGAARTLPLPILIKPVAGGGGKGMHVVNDFAELDELVARARREAAAAFGDDRLLFEKYLPRARHIEVQVIGLPGGEVVALGDRECSLQRRHQKVVEEAPAPNLPDAVRTRIHRAAEAVVREVDYLNAGTVEFVVSCDDPEEFYFLEVNTRLQVEHPVTESVMGVDLVRVQLQVAFAAHSEPSTTDLATFLKSKRDAGPCGHAVEARIYAEDPTTGFLPSAGPLLVAAWPGAVRVDTGVRRGDVVTAGYDPMIAKVIAYADTREQAWTVLDDALAETSVLGLSTNIAFLRALAAHEQVRSGQADTRFIDRNVDTLIPTADVPWWVPILGAALWAQDQATSHGAVAVPSVWNRSWRLAGQSAGTTWRALLGEDAVTCTVSRDASAPHTWLVGYQGTVGSVALACEAAHVEFQIHSDGKEMSATAAYAIHSSATADELWIAHSGGAWQFLSGRAAAGNTTSGASPDVRSPMPGTVTAVLVASGEAVSSGQPLVVLEAMKMEHRVLAPHDGVIAQVCCTVGSHVRLREVLAVVDPT